MDILKTVVATVGFDPDVGTERGTPSTLIGRLPIVTVVFALVALAGTPNVQRSVGPPLSFRYPSGVSIPGWLLPSDDASSVDCFSRSAARLEDV